MGPPRSGPPNGPETGVRQASALLWSEAGGQPEVSPLPGWVLLCFQLWFCGLWLVRLVFDLRTSPFGLYLADRQLTVRVNPGFDFLNTCFLEWEQGQLLAKMPLF